MPLLPEFLSQPIQIVMESPSTDWKAIMASGLFTLIGAALGAGLGGWVAYRGTLKANRSLVSQSKLEECLTLIHEIEGVYWNKLDQLRRIPKSQSLTKIQDMVGASDPEGIVRTAAKIHTLVKLHSPQMKSNADLLLARALITRDLFNYINDRRAQVSENTNEGWRGISSELAVAIAELCSEIKNHIEIKAKTS